MKHVIAMACATLAAVMVVGCGAADDAGSTEGAASPSAPSAEETAAVAGAELARIEFEDGNVVRFEDLAGGVLISELGPDHNPRHLVAKEGMTALAMYQALAPGRTVPAALMRMHERLYPTGAALAPSEGAVPGATPVTEEAPFDADLEHNGEFQQSYPAASFLQTMCDFPTNNGLNYKHTNRTDVHTDTSMGVHTAYFAVGADIGTITARACAGKNAGGYFNGICGSTVTVNAGYHQSGYYDAGLSCPGDPNLFCQIFGCPKICTYRLVRFHVEHGKISTNVRFHECARLSP
jgi:hypothetical protein